MLEYLTLFEFVVATLMGLAALCRSCGARRAGPSATWGGQVPGARVEGIDHDGSRYDRRMSGTWSSAGEVEEFARRRGPRLPRHREPWLLAVYAMLAVWGVYYLFKSGAGWARAGR